MGDGICICEWYGDVMKTCDGMYDNCKSVRSLDRMDRQRLLVSVVVKAGVIMASSMILVEFYSNSHSLIRIKESRKIRMTMGDH